MNTITIKNLTKLSYAGNEAINTLCTNLTFSGENVKKIMITSCHAAEGKSFLSLHVADTMTKLGYKVALVDMDLRKSTIARTHLSFGDVPARGATHYLAGLAELEDIIYATNIDNFLIVPAGKTALLLNEVAKLVDYVIVDVPPAGMLIDPTKIATHCDGILLAVNYNAVRKQELMDVQEQLEQSGTPILGTVLNQADFGDYLSRKYYYSRYYYNHYYYYYNNSTSSNLQKRQSSGFKKNR